MLDMVIGYSCIQIRILLSLLFAQHLTDCLALLHIFFICREKAEPANAGNSQDSFPEKNNEVEDDDYDDYLDNSPLFFQPGKAGFYSPRCGKISVERLNCYRNVGRSVDHNIKLFSSFDRRFKQYTIKMINCF